MSNAKSTVSSSAGINLTAYNTLKREVDTDRQFYELMSQTGLRCWRCFSCPPV